MKKIIVSVLTLLTFFGSQSSALDKSKVKKTLSNVCTKVLPAVAVTVGVGFLIHKLYNNSQNKSTPTKSASAPAEKNSISSKEPSSKKPRVKIKGPFTRIENSTPSSVENKSVPTKPASAPAEKNSINSEETIRISESEQAALDDGVRFIYWQRAMCWFNASILQLYYNDFYREKLLNLDENSTKNIKNDTDKNAIIELSNLIKRLHNATRCMCKIDDQEYERIFNIIEKSLPTIRKYGRQNNCCYEELSSLINRCLGCKAEDNKNNVGLIIYGPGHYYNLYYVKETNRLYTIAQSVCCNQAYENQVIVRNLTNENEFINMLKSAYYYEKTYEVAKPILYDVIDKKTGKISKKVEVVTEDKQYIIKTTTVQTNETKECAVPRYRKIKANENSYVMNNNKLTSLFDNKALKF